MSSDSTNRKEQRRKAQHLYDAGDVRGAIEIQIGIINEQRDVTPFPLDDHRRLALYLFTFGDFASALSILENAKQQVEPDFELQSNLGVVLARLGRYEDAIPELLVARSLNQDDANIHDALAHGFGRVGKHEEAIKCGEVALLLKARAQKEREACALPSEHPPAFEPAHPKRNVISFSLWGKQPRYLDGAIKNATHAPVVYPDWSCRFYCDETVPQAVRDKLEALGSEVRMMPQQKTLFEGLFWRFMVIDDPDVSHFLIRDCDAVINVKERVAVDDWLQSGKWFHLMRDWYSHTDLVLAGMWGGVRGVFPSIQERINSFRSDHVRTRTLDQEFLREAVWPTLAQSCCIHDRFFRVLGAKPFPPYGDLPSDQHVGQNAAVLQKSD